jgi:hypothetical protein
MMYFTRKNDGSSIEEFIKERKSTWKEHWKAFLSLNVQGDAAIWWRSLDYSKMMALPDEEFEKVLLDM